MFYEGQSGDHLLQPLCQIAFTLEEEAKLSISSVVSKVRRALDVERLTKRFYERFRSELTAFASFIEGFTTHRKRLWFTSASARNRNGRIMIARRN